MAPHPLTSNFLPSLQWGTYVLALVDGERKLLMQGSGASPEGNQPFLDLLQVDTKESRRIWQVGSCWFTGVKALRGRRQARGRTARSRAASGT